MHFSIPFSLDYVVLYYSYGVVLFLVVVMSFLFVLLLFCVVVTGTHLVQATLSFV